MKENKKQYHFDAFICYPQTPRCKRIAEWLQKYIERYRKEPYRKLRRTKLRIFLDCEEGEASHTLSSFLCSSLDGSRYLIVLCSPETKKRDWVMREISYFYNQAGGSDRILPVLIEGEPADVYPETADIERIPADLRFYKHKKNIPFIFRILYRMIAILPRCNYETLCTSHHERSIFEYEVLRVLAPLKNCSFSELRARNVAWRRRQRLYRLTAVILFAFVSIIAGMMTIRHRDEQHRKESFRLVQLSQLELKTSPSKSLHLALRAVQESATTEAIQTLRTCMDYSYESAHVMNKLDFLDRVEKLQVINQNRLAVCLKNHPYILYLDTDFNIITDPNASFFANNETWNQQQACAVLLHDTLGLTLIDHNRDTISEHPSIPHPGHASFHPDGNHFFVTPKIPFLCYIALFSDAGRLLKIYSWDKKPLYKAALISAVDDDNQICFFDDGDESSIQQIQVFPTTNCILITNEKSNKIHFIGWDGSLIRTVSLEGTFSTAAWDPMGDYLIVATKQGHIGYFSNWRDSMPSYHRPENPTNVACLGWSLSQSRFYAGIKNGPLVMFDPIEGILDEYDAFPGKRKTVEKILWNSNEKYLSTISSGSRKDITIWEETDEGLEPRAFIEDTDLMNPVWSRDRQCIATSKGHSVLVLENHGSIPNLPLIGHDSNVEGLVWFSGQLCSWSSSGQCIVWDPKRFTPTKVMGAIYTPDGSNLVVLHNNSIRICNSLKNDLFISIPKLYNEVSIFSTNGAQIVVDIVDEEYKIESYSFKGQKLWSHEIEEKINDYQWHPFHNKLFVAMSMGGWLIQEDGSKIIFPIDQSIYLCKWSSGGTHLLTLSESEQSNGTLHVWDQEGKLIDSFEDVFTAQWEENKIIIAKQDQLVLYSPTSQNIVNIQTDGPAHLLPTGQYFFDKAIIKKLDNTIFGKVPHEYPELMTVSPDSKRLVWINHQEDNKLQMFDLQGEPVGKPHYLSNIQQQTSWNRQGSHCIFVDLSNHTYVFNASGEEIMRINPQVHEDGILMTLEYHWHPNGKEFIRIENGQLSKFSISDESLIQEARGQIIGKLSGTDLIRFGVKALDRK